MVNPPPRECRHLRERLPQYAEGALDQRQAAPLERHLASCARCSAELADLRLIIRRLREIGPAEAPAHLPSDVRRAVAAAAARPSPPPALPRQFWTRIALPVAVTGALVVVAFALRQPPASHTLAPAAPGPRPAAAGRAGVGGRGAAVPGGLQVARTPEPAAPSEGAPREESLAIPDAAAPMEAAGERPGPEMSYRASVRDSASAAGSRGLGGAGPPGPLEALDRAAGGEAAVAGAAICEGAVCALPSAPPVSARAVPLRQDGRLALGLRLAADQGVREVAVHVRTAAGPRLLWRGRPAEAGALVVPAEHIGQGPTALALSIEAAEASRDYILFVPTLARLGEIAPAAPRARYDNVPLREVLADLSALTGLVVLAEQPLDRGVMGEMPAGEPGEVLRRIAASAGLEVVPEDALVWTLTHRRTPQ